MTRAATNAAKTRKRVLGAIHIAAKQLGLDEETYRSLIARVSAAHGAEQTSCATCTPAQLNAIANELRRISGKPAQAAQNARTWAGKPKGDLSPQLAKIEALLADAGREWAYVHSLTKKLCKGVARVEWCNQDQLAKVIAALQIDADRRARRAATE